MTHSTELTKHTAGPWTEITHDQADASLRRFENTFWKREPHARVSIPANPGYDDDLILHRYIEQQRALSRQQAPGWSEAIEAAAKIVEAPYEIAVESFSVDGHFLRNISGETDFLPQSAVSKMLKERIAAIRALTPATRSTEQSGEQ